MSRVSLFAGICFITVFFSLPAGAETIEDIKATMEEMKRDYETRIKGLEERIETLSGQQQENSAKIEDIATQHEAQAAAMEQKIDAKTLDVEYVGRGNAPVGKGGLVIGNPFGFGNVSVGRYNLYHDSDLQNLTERPIVARDVIPTTWTEAGAGIFGGFNPVLGSYEDLNLNYELYMVNGLDTGFSDTGLSGARASLKTDNNDDKAVVGRVAASPWLNQEVGVSGYWGEYDTAGHAIAGVGVDSLVTIGPLEWINEYAYFGVEQGSSDVANFF